LIGSHSPPPLVAFSKPSNLDEAIKEVNLLGEHEEESSHKITELEAMCKRLRKDTQKLREEKTTLEGIIQSCDELIMEMAKEYGLNRMGKNDDDEGNAVAPLASAVVPEDHRRKSPNEEWSIGAG
jgi:predicted nuclease with TOPRIM domain